MSFRLPEKLSLARLPTPIQPLPRMADRLGVKGLYVKRDDLTDTPMTGNKVRKLEYLLAEAVRKKATAIITCGGNQSNHARATAIAAVRLGMKPFLVLRGRKFEISEGNLFLDKLVGAEIRFITPEEYRRVDKIMAQEAKRLSGKGEKPYIIPEGGSNELGLLGYVDALREVKTQEKELRKHFDYIITAVGSGGTLSGLILGKKLLKVSSEIIGINVCDTADYFVARVRHQIESAIKRWKFSGLKIADKDIRVVDGYVGPGYAIPYDETISLMKEVARTEGIFLDPVYTSKAFYGMMQEINKGNWDKKANYLFIHTGGIYGLFAQREHFDFL